MKKNLFIFAVSALLLGCTDLEDVQENKINQQPLPLSSHVSKADALDIANKVLKKASNTRNSQEEPVFEYVLNENTTLTRYATLPDTLAYVINYPNNEGFVIVSSDKRVYPVLGFSNKGTFAFDNEIAKVNFIDRIGDYIGNANATKLYDVQDEDWGGCYAVEPVVKTSLGQRAPWNKYVIKEHPNCPVGCVAVATALLLSHSMTELSYHGTTFYFKSIIEAINKQQTTDDYTDITDLYDDWNEIEQPTYTYEQAVDSMAKLLYYIGKDIKTDYKEKGSYALYRNAYNLCKELKGNIDIEYPTFNINDVSWLLKNNNIIFLQGSSHAWVSDGCYFCVSGGKDGITSGNPGVSVGGDSQNEEILSTYIHCDWGWSGKCNGYYSGEVFETSYGDFIPSKYFALKRDHKKNNGFTPKF